MSGRSSVSRGEPALCNWSKLAVGTVPCSDVQQATSRLHGVSEKSVGFVLGHTGLVLFSCYSKFAGNQAKEPEPRTWKGDWGLC